MKPMTNIVVSVRYPLSDTSRRTLDEALRLADEHGADLTVLHVNNYHSGRRVTRDVLERAVERSFGRLRGTSYVVRTGFLIEEAILEEATAEGADVVVVGRNRGGFVRRLSRRVVGTPDVERYLRERLDCRVVTVPRAESRASR